MQVLTDPEQHVRLYMLGYMYHAPNTCWRNTTSITHVLRPLHHHLSPPVWRWRWNCRHRSWRMQLWAQWMLRSAVSARRSTHLEAAVWSWCGPTLGALVGKDKTERRCWCCPQMLKDCKRRWWLRPSLVGHLAAVVHLRMFTLIKGFGSRVFVTICDSLGSTQPHCISKAIA